MSDDKSAIQTIPETVAPEDIEQVLFYGNLETLTVAQRNSYLVKLCKHLGISPMTKPFDMLNLNGKLTVYANKGAAAQLQDSRKISVEVTYAGLLKLGEELNKDIYIVEVATKDVEGRTGCNVGAVSIKGLVGEALSNAIMKCHTKASRRAILQHTGLGFPDETEVGSIPQQPMVTVDAGVTRILPPSEVPRKL